MNVYVESNFVLELALLQEQSDSARQIVEAARTPAVKLVVPAFSIAEPHQTLHRRARQRDRLAGELQMEVDQLLRSKDYTDQAGPLGQVSVLLYRSTEQETDRLITTINDLLATADLIPLDATILRRADSLARDRSLTPPDAIVLASVLLHLESTRPERSCFLNRNVRDFDDADIKNMLRQHHCRLIPSFEHGLAFIRARTGQ